MIKPKKGIHILPSLFTTGNVFCGFYSFIAALNDKYFLAAWAIVLAIIFDVLDGRIARMTKTTSAFGMQRKASIKMRPSILHVQMALTPKHSKEMLGPCQRISRQLKNHIAFRMHW